MANCQCKMCRENLDNSDSNNSFKCFATNNEYDININNINPFDLSPCQLNNVIYLITCNLCHQQYVGLTADKLQRRVNHHRSMSNNKTKSQQKIHKHFIRDCPSKANFNSNAKFKIIDRIIEKEKDENVEKQLKDLETCWIDELNTVHPNGLNIAKPKKINTVMKKEVRRRRRRGKMEKEKEEFLLSSPFGYREEKVDDDEEKRKRDMRRRMYQTRKINVEEEKEEEKEPLVLKRKEEEEEQQQIQQMRRMKGREERKRFEEKEWLTTEYYSTFKNKKQSTKGKKTIATSVINDITSNLQNMKLEEEEEEEESRGIAATGVRPKAKNIRNKKNNCNNTFLEQQ